MEIRKAKKSDLEEIFALGFKLLKYHMQYNDYYKPVKSKKEFKSGQKKYFTEQLQKRNSLFLVLDDDGKLAGYSIAKVTANPPVLREKKRGEFAEIFIDEKYRGKGWGSKMLEYSLAWLSKKKIRQIVVKYDAKNQWAENLYKDAGFSPFQNEYELILK
ncbi:GNAT family N-acetyltransferase [Candidatus Micrarchaeota archaeon]|nr:GNAT family N-acetyltransferase [Candidatus Micrarchaeota archaeon]